MEDKIQKDKWIIDTDPGCDDMLAISYLLANRDIDVLMLSTVDGNVSREKVTKNAKKIVKLMRRETPIYNGSSMPIFKQFNNAESYHLEDGLGEIDEIKNYDANDIIVEKESAIVKMVEYILEYPHQINLLLIGPLTNVAAAYLLCPDIANLVKNVYIMGGSFLSRGNLNPPGEFNFGYDAIAAKVIISNFKKVTLIPWEPTENLRIKPPLHETIPKKVSFKNKILNETLHLFSSLIVAKFSIIHHGIQFCDLYASMAAFYKKSVKKFSISKLDIIIDSPNISGMLSVKNRKEINQEFETFMEKEIKNLDEEYHIVVEEFHENEIFDHYDTVFHF